MKFYACNVLFLVSLLSSNLKSHSRLRFCFMSYILGYVFLFFSSCEHMGCEIYLQTIMCFLWLWTVFSLGYGLHSFWEASEIKILINLESVKFTKFRFQYKYGVGSGNSKHKKLYDVYDVQDFSLALIKTWSRWEFLISLALSPWWWFCIALTTPRIVNPILGLDFTKETDKSEHGQKPVRDLNEKPTWEG